MANKDTFMRADKELLKELSKIKIVKQESYASVVKRLMDWERKYYKKNSKNKFVPCPNRAWHHLGTTCEVCGQHG